MRDDELLAIYGATRQLAEGMQARDAELKPRIAAVHAGNYGVFGARKVWLTLNRERAADEAPIARCTVERLMKELGLQGAVRGKAKRTTISDPRTPKPHDLVERNFWAPAPNRLWFLGESCFHGLIGEPVFFGDGDGMCPAVRRAAKHLKGSLAGIARHDRAHHAHRCVAHKGKLIEKGHAHAEAV